jgi:hypothetical protein
MPTDKTSITLSLSMCSPDSTTHYYITDEQPAAKSTGYGSAPQDADATTYAGTPLNASRILFAQITDRSAARRSPSAGRAAGAAARRGNSRARSHPAHTEPAAAAVVVVVVASTAVAAAAAAAGLVLAAVAVPVGKLGEPVGVRLDMQDCAGRRQVARVARGVSALGARGTYRGTKVQVRATAVM